MTEKFNMTLSLLMMLRGKVLRHTSAVALYLDSDWYLRNALAYVPKNALDALSRVEDYRWSGYRGMFCQGKTTSGFRRADTLTRREKEACFHTHDSLDGLPWILNANGELEPASTCDHAYLEAAFNHDQAFFLKTIGTVNMAEMQQKLVDNPRQRQNDTKCSKPSTASPRAGSNAVFSTCRERRKSACSPTYTALSGRPSRNSPDASDWNRKKSPAKSASPARPPIRPMDECTPKSS